jgi:hypothetical protein
VEDDLGDSMALFLDHRPPEHCVGPLTNRGVRNEVIRLAGQVNRVQGIRRDEGADRDGLLVLRAELIQLVRIDDDILPFPILEAGDDLFVAYLTLPHS